MVVGGRRGLVDVVRGAIARWWSVQEPVTSADMLDAMSEAPVL